jgi:hypothetical protein
MDFAGNATPLGNGDINTQATAIGVEAAAIWAVCDVESAGSGFLSDGRPKILFEAHSFHTLTHGRYDNTDPNISSPSWDRSLYGASGAHQYERLADAIELDRTAALESASWGRFQIMGSNFSICGYSDIEKFVADMVDNEANHLKAFVNFCKSNHLIGYLQSHDWAHFALRYNGPGQVDFYAQKIASAYQRHAAHQGTSIPSGASATLRQGSSGPAVMELQQRLIRLGYNIQADGDFGPRSDSAVRDFQTQNNLSADGIVGPATLAAIKAAAP